MTGPYRLLVRAQYVFLSGILIVCTFGQAGALVASSPPSPPLWVGLDDGASLSRSAALKRITLPTLATMIPTLSIPTRANGMYENAPLRGDQTGPVKLSSGVSYEDLRPGTSSVDVVEEGKRVNIQWVLKRSNGYLVDSSERNEGVPFIFTVGDPKGAIAGLDEGIRGLRVGGIRRIIIPPELAYVDGVEDGKPGPVPSGFGPKQRIRRVMILLKDIPGESLMLDVKATRVQ
eukprot:CAMPEP_0197720514 /NCGR_PEP_ID=MMETSP1434-20131217/3863_1 /TAXON_ID=265543 /ORGANISM="Minutocellus polymorphus, Strain CCMP3303" /LENGTH=231 /DNA_ID=CAMNT_0043305389 /DNA_START=99 /DNA_END=794 /DNA_ORIENTATION=-